MEHPFTLVRPRLIARLRKAVQQPVAVITAPAGYGKTVLVEQWAAQHEGAPVTRLRLRQVGDWVGVAARLKAELTARGEAILVLDAVDTCTDKRTADALGQLVERPLGDLHVVLVSRSRSAPVLEVLRGRTDVAFLTAADLTFTASEARSLVGSVCGAHLTDEGFERLMACTGGWPAGLAVGVLGLRDAPDPEAYVKGFAGHERHVAAVLFGDVFGDLAPEVRRFLAETSVLDRLNGPLCDAVTGGHAGAALLGSLERSGVFLQRAAGARGWFEYHALFRDFLRWELRRGEYTAESVLLGRAGAWFAGAEQPGIAARYFIEGEAWNAVLHLADSFGQRMFESGHGAELRNWLDALPPAEASRADVAIERAYVHTMLGDTQRAAQVVHDLNRKRLTRGEQVVVDTLRAAWALFDATPESTLRAADSALRALETVDPGELPNVFGMTSPTSVVMIAAGCRARALWYLGDVASGRRVLSAGLQQRGAYAPWLVHTLSALALLEAWAGDLRAARAHGVRASVVARQNGLLQHPAMLDARLALAHVCRERGHPKRAVDLIEGAERIAARTRRPVTAAVIAVERALCHLSFGEAEQGLAVLKQFRESSEERPPPLVAAHLAAAEVKLHLLLGDIEEAELALAYSPGISLCPDLAAAGVHAAVAHRDIEVAITRLDGWRVDEAQPRNRLLHDVWAAVIDFECGERRQAVEVFAGAVDQGEHEGDVRAFLDGGRPVERLVRVVAQGGSSPYAERLVELARRDSSTTGPAVFGLSKRELEVARYLPTPLSSAEIAARLYISLNTLKTHLRTIYGKLGASNRREAIQRAEELGIA